MHGMTIEAACILPSHLHLVLALPEHDGDLGTRIGLVKASFSRSLAPLEPRSRSRLRRGERGVWQRRFWEHWIRDERDLANHVDYVHFNPVKHGLARRAIDWPCSSLHRYVARGYLPLDWKSDSKITVAGDE